VSWKVVGKHAVFGVAPGGVIEKEIPRRQANHLVQGGHIAPLAASSAEQEADNTDAENPEEGD
jgi:hypothetical protein